MKQRPERHIANAPRQRRAWLVLAATATALLLPAHCASAGERWSDYYDSRPVYFELGLGGARPYPVGGGKSSILSGALTFGYQLHRFVSLELSHTRFNLLSGEINSEVIDTNLSSLALKLTFPTKFFGQRFYLELGPARYQYRHSNVNPIPDRAVFREAAPGTLSIKHSGLSVLYALGYEWTTEWGFYTGFEASFSFFRLDGAEYGYTSTPAGESVAATLAEPFNYGVVGLFFTFGYRL